MDFFDKVTQLYDLKIPFVIFRKPNVDMVEVFKQNDDRVHLFDKSFSMDGFVLAPFRIDDEPSVILRADEKFQFLYKGVENELVTNDYFPIEDEEVKNQHLSLVEAAIEQMKLDVFQKVVLSRNISLKYRGNPVAAFKKMLCRYPSTFCYLFFHHKVGTWLAATPEKLMKCIDNQLFTMSLAGTQPFRENQTIVWQKKEIAEQKIVTDVIVNRISSFTQDLNISQVQTLRAGSVVHLCTHISAKLLKGINPFSVIDKLHPTPAVCGFPNEIAQKFIVDNEPYNRSFYTGYCGIVDQKEKSLDFYVNLRCMQFVDNEVVIYVGGGILKESDPAAEWEETRHKAKTMFAIL